MIQLFSKLQKKKQGGFTIFALLNKSTKQQENSLSHTSSFEKPKNSQIFDSFSHLYLKTRNTLLEPAVFLRNHHPSSSNLLQIVPK